MANITKWINMMLNILAWLLFPLLVLASPLAQSPQDGQIIDREHYSLSYNEEHEVANWVAYPLGHAQIRGCVDRTDAFRIDPLVTTGSSTLADYKNSNFDRGHLLPAGDMKFEAQAMKDTFFMSNMTPQPAKFNRGRWSMLETLMRSWALKYQQTWIVTGPILKENLPTIGLSQVSVPLEYFKVVLRKEGQSYKGIGFLMSVDVPYPQLISYALSINQIEDLSGVDFFPFLSDNIEEEIESETDLSGWDFQAKFNYLPCAI
jgi:endonuclease G